jgi:CheY-like chemotaxis protein
MAKYGTRHYAHAVCLYQRRGIEAIDALHTWQLRHLPIVAMMGVGVTLDQVRAWQVRIAAEDAELAERYSTKVSDEDGASEDE